MTEIIREGINNSVENYFAPGPFYEDPQVQLVGHELTTGGFVSIHFLSGRKDSFEKAKAAWMGSIPWESEDNTMYYEYREAGIWHFHLLWPARGLVVRVFDNPEKLGLANDIILWVVQRGERVSEAVEAAAWYFLAWFGEWPDTAWVGQKMKKSAGRTVTVRDHEIHLVAADWMADEGVGVGIEWMEEGDHE